METSHKIYVWILIISILLSLYFYFFTFLQFFFIAIFIFAGFLMFVVYSVYKKYLVGSIKNENEYTLRQKAVQLFQQQGYKIKEKNECIYVEKNWITKTGVLFIQNGSQVDMFRRNAATRRTWVLIIIGAFFFGIVAIVVGLISENNSKEFAEKTIYPLLKGQDEYRRCTSCGRVIPDDSRVCAYCGRRV